MSAGALKALSRITAAIFNTAVNATNQRNGLKELRKNLVGPAIINYYPSAATQWARLDKDYVDEDIEYGMSKAARLRRRGKGPPKKGTQRLRTAPRTRRCHPLTSRVRATDASNAPCAPTQARASAPRSRRKSSRTGLCARALFTCTAGPPPRVASW